MRQILLSGKNIYKLIEQTMNNPYKFMILILFELILGMKSNERFKRAYRWGKCVGTNKFMGRS